MPVTAAIIGGITSAATADAARRRQAAAQAASQNAQSSSLAQGKMGALDKGLTSITPQSSASPIGASGQPGTPTSQGGWLDKLQGLLSNPAASPTGPSPAIGLAGQGVSTALTALGGDAGSISTTANEATAGAPTESISNITDVASGVVPEMGYGPSPGPSVPAEGSMPSHTSVYNDPNQEQGAWSDMAKTWGSNDQTHAGLSTGPAGVGMGVGASGPPSQDPSPWSQIGKDLAAKAGGALINTATGIGSQFLYRKAFPRAKYGRTIPGFSSGAGGQ